MASAKKKLQNDEHGDDGISLYLVYFSWLESSIATHIHPSPLTGARRHTSRTKACLYNPYFV